MTRDSFTREELQIAFAFYFTRMVMHADEVLHPFEIEFMNRLFGPRVMLGCGYITPDGSGLTDRFELAVQTAIHSLGDALGQGEKLAIVDILIKACEADGEVDPRETTVVLQAARALGLAEDEVIAYVRTAASLSAPSPTHPTDGLAASLAEQPGTLVLTQSQLYEALAKPESEPAASLRQRLDAVLCNTNAALVVVMGPDDVRSNAIHGWRALVSHLAREASLSNVAGRLGFAIEGYEQDPRELFEIPETRAFLSSLLDVYPWLPIWMSPASGVAGQMVSSLAELDPSTEMRTVPESFFAAALHCANYAAALALRDDEPSLTHVHAFLAQFGVTDLHPSFFDGVEVLGTEMDAMARRVAMLE